MRKPSHLSANSNEDKSDLSNFFKCVSTPTEFKGNLNSDMLFRKATTDNDYRKFSGLSGVFDKIEDPKLVSYGDIP